VTESRVRRSPHRSKTIWILGILSVAVVGACATAQQSQQVWVYLPTCAGADAAPPFASAQATYFPTGDFPLVDGGVMSRMNATGSALGIPASSRSLEVTVTSVGAAWEGVSLVPDGGQVNVLTLPENTTCTLSGSYCAGTTMGFVGSPLVTDPPLPQGSTGETLGLVDAQHALLVGAGSAWEINLGTGCVEHASPEPIRARFDASVTPFGGGALVAGGRDFSGGSLENTAEVYRLDPNGGVGGFTQVPVLLVKPRQMHGAVELASGETVLFGGLGGSGPEALASLESIAPEPEMHSSMLLATTLAMPRLIPTVFRVPTATRQIFVGGGVDQTGHPLNSVEWLDGDLRALAAGETSQLESLCTTATVASPGPPWSFAPLEGGAVLAVFPGKPPAGCASNVFVLRSDAIEPLLHPIAPLTPPVLLFAAAQSEPLLITADTAMRWLPWEDAFQQSMIALPTGTLPTLTYLSADPGLALWLGASGSQIHALRFDTRNIYSTDSPNQAPLLMDDTNEFAPDRLVGQDVAFGMSQLTLSNGAAVFYTDASFADVAVTFLPSSSQLTPAFRDDDTGAMFPVDLAGCLSHGTSFGNTETPVELQRIGATISAGFVTEQGTSLIPCTGKAPAMGERVAIGFTAPATGSVTLTGVTVTRLGSAN
jgi:hypothetical protein